jgi:carboxyl-terminal processing protease
LLRTAALASRELAESENDFMPFALVGSGVVTLAMVVLAFQGSQTLDTPPRAVHNGEANRTASSLRGVWREVGYGRLLEISEFGFDQYHETSILCYRDEGVVDAPLDSRYALYDLSPNGKTLTLYFHDLGKTTRQFQNHQRFERLSSLPAGCVPSLKEPRFERPEFIFDLFWQTFADYYAFFDERGVNWKRRREDFRPRVRADMTPSELFDLFSEMLGPLNDGHVNLYLGQDRRFSPGRNSLIPILRREFDRLRPAQDFGGFVGAWVSGQQKAASAFVRGEIRKAANDTIWWGHVDDHIGYINIYALTGFIQDATWSNRAQQLAIVDDALEEILVAFRDKRAILLDLTHNQGGFDAASDLVASRFADRARHVLTVQAFRTPESKAESVTVVPSGRTRFTRPVFLLTSEVTVSAGEGLVAMLRAFPHVTHMGQRTRGYLSGILNKPLPASLAVSVTSQVIRTPAGDVYEGGGIVPQVAVDVFPTDDILGGYPLALQKAAGLIRATIAKSPR